MTQIPPRNSFEKATNEGHLASNGFPIGGQIPAIEESSSFSTLLPPQKSEPSEKTRSLPLQKPQNPWWHFRSLNLTSLRTKTTILALAIGTIPVALVGTTAYFTASKGIEEQIVQSEKTNAEDLEDKLNLFVKERYNDILTLSKLDAFTNPKVRAALTTEEKNAIIKDWMESSNVYNSIVVYNPPKEELLALAGGEINRSQLFNAD